MLTSLSVAEQAECPSAGLCLWECEARCGWWGLGPLLECGLALLPGDLSTWGMGTSRARLRRVWSQPVHSGLREALRACHGGLGLLPTLLFSQIVNGNCHHGQTQNGVNTGGRDLEQAGGWERAVKPCGPASLGVPCVLPPFSSRSHPASHPCPCPARGQQQTGPPLILTTAATSSTSAISIAPAVTAATVLAASTAVSPAAASPAPFPTPPQPAGRRDCLGAAREPSSNDRRAVGEKFTSLGMGKKVRLRKRDRG